MYRRYEAPAPLLVGYDPYTELPKDHLARLVEMVVEESVVVKTKGPQVGQPEFDPRLCLKVLVYGYATGVRSSRQLEKQCRESLPYLFLTRGDTPSYRTLCSFRIGSKDLLEKVWIGLFGVAKELGLKRLGRIVVDSTKLRANTSSEMILDRDEYAAVKQEFLQILDEAEAKDKQEDAEGYAGETRTGKEVDNLQTRDILRKVRRELSKQSEPDRTTESGAKGGAAGSDTEAPKGRTCQSG
jgi:transposase